MQNISNDSNAKTDSPSINETAGENVQLLSLRRDGLLKTAENINHCQRVRWQTSHGRDRRRPLRKNSARVTLAGDGRVLRASNILRAGLENPRPANPRAGPEIPRAGPRGLSKIPRGRPATPRGRPATPRGRPATPRGRPRRRTRWTTWHFREMRKRRKNWKY